MSIFDNVIKEIDKGIEGRNTGISMKIGVLGDEICNLLPSTYYLLGGESGTGKTALVDTAFCINPLDQVLSGRTDKKLKIFYHSLEISKERKWAKWACIRLFKKYGMIMDSKTLLGMRESKISQEVYDKVVECRNYFDKLQDMVIIDDNGIHPTGVYYKMKDYCESVGTVNEKVEIHQGKEYKSKEYKPNDPDEIVLSITDHVGLLRTEKDALDSKKKLDKHSHYCVDLRNMYGVSSVNISQFNRDLADYGRQKFAELAPQDADFKGTGNMYEDADTVLALLSPRRHNIHNYHKYDITLFKNRIMFGFILKNRDGDDNISKALNFLGEAGFFRKFPTVSELEVSPMLKEKLIKFLK